MHDGSRGHDDDLDATHAGPWLNKLEESLSKIERGVAHMRNAGMASHPALSQIQSGASRLRRMVDQVEEIERMRTQAIALQPVELHLIAVQAIDAAKAASGFTGIISIGKLVPLVADTALVLAALRELVANAVRFSNGLEGARVEIEAFSAAGSTIIAVRDNGIGFDTDVAERLFVPYATLHAGSPRAGAGLGLVLVRLAVARHGGRAWARSMPGGSTEFFMSFPLRSERPHGRAGDSP